MSLRQTWLLPIYYSRSGIKQDTSSVMEGLHHDLNASDWREHRIPLSSDLIQPSIVRPKPGACGSAYIPRLVCVQRGVEQSVNYRVVN